MTDIARFKIGNKVYSTSALDEISLRDLVVFNTEVSELGIPYSWADVERIGTEMADMTEEEAKRHPDAMFITGVTIWASRRSAGDEVTFLEAIDVKLKDLQFLPSTEDKRPSGKARKKTGPKASARAGSKEADLSAETTSETSVLKSVNA